MTDGGPPRKPPEYGDAFGFVWWDRADRRAERAEYAAAKANGSDVVGGFLFGGDPCLPASMMELIDGRVVQPAAPSAGRIVPVRLTLDRVRDPLREKFIWGRAIPFSKSSVLYGPTSAGKSALGAQLVVAFASGVESLWGLPLFPGGGPVLVYTTEDSREDWERKLAAIAVSGIDVERGLERIHIVDRSDGLARLFEIVTVREGNRWRRVVLPTTEQEQLITLIREVGARFALIETASRLVEDETNAEFSALQSALGRIGRETGAAVLTTHHATKAATKGNDSSLESARGGSAFIYNARNAIALFPLELELAKDYVDRFSAEDLFVLSHGKPTSSTKRQASIVLVRCDATHGAVFHLPDEVAFTPEERAAAAVRAERARQREGDRLARLYDVVGRLLPLGPVSPSKLRDHVREIGVEKRALDALLTRALELGVLVSVELVGGGRGARFGLGRDPRKPPDAGTTGDNRQ